MIVTYVPYCPYYFGEPKGEDVGGTVNDFFDKRMLEFDWCFVSEHDVMATTHDWYRRMERHAEAHPDAILMPLRWYCHSSNPALKPRGDRLPDLTNIEQHFELGARLAECYDGESETVDVQASPLAALWLLSKETWRKAGGFPHGFKGYDRQFYKRAREQEIEIRVMLDVYFMHAKRAALQGREKPR